MAGDHVAEERDALEDVLELLILRRGLVAAIALAAHSLGPPWLAWSMCWAYCSSARSSRRAPAGE